MKPKFTRGARRHLARGLTRYVGLVLLLAVAGLASTSAARACGVNQAPDLPSPLCDRLQVPPGNEVAFHVYALGAQVYRWNGAG